MWIARDKYGSLCLFTDKPHKEEKHNELMNYIDENYVHIYIDSSLFPEVKWEDDEPTEVELVIKK